MWTSRVDLVGCDNSSREERVRNSRVDLVGCENSTQVRCDNSTRVALTSNYIAREVIPILWEFSARRIQVERQRKLISILQSHQTSQ